VPGGIAGPPCTIQPCKKVIVTKPQRGGQGPNWGVEPYDDDDDDDDDDGDDDDDDDDEG